MSVYTVHEPPLRATDVTPDPARFVFVRDGFYWWAFLASWLWMLWHRMWLVLLIYIVVAVGLESALYYYVGVGRTAVALVGLFIAFLVGIEAGPLRRFTLDRRGWKNIGVVSGDDIESAERRFFDAWLRTGPGRRRQPPPLPLGQSPLPRAPHAPDIIGLFPEPGGAGR